MADEKYIASGNIGNSENISETSQVSDNPEVSEQVLQEQKTKNATKKLAKVAAQGAATYFGGAAAGSAVGAINDSGAAEGIYDKVTDSIDQSLDMVPGGGIAKEAINALDDAGVVDLASDVVGMIGSKGAGAGAKAAGSGAKAAGNGAKVAGANASSKGELLKSAPSNISGNKQSSGGNSGVASVAKDVAEEKLKSAAKTKIKAFIIANPWVLLAAGGILAALFIIFAILVGNDGNGRSGSSISGYFDETCDFTRTMVDVANCYNSSDQKIVLQQVSLQDYVMGVTYGEIGSSYPDEAIKAQMVAAKTFALVRGRYDAATKKITIKSCNADQVFCDIYNGCYKTSENFFGTDTVVGRVTFVSYGADYQYSSNNGMYKGPLSEEMQLKFKDLYNSIETQLFLQKGFSGPITDYTQLDNVGYLNTTQHLWKSYAENGMAYDNILTSTGTSSDSRAHYYSNKELYYLEDHCSYQGISGEGEYQFSHNSDGSVNVDAAPKFIPQAGNNLSFNYTAKNGKSIGTIYLQNCSCGPTSVTMIAYALGNVSYLDEYFGGNMPTGDTDLGRLYAGMMHVYMYDLGVNGNPNRTETHCGGISSQAASKTLWSTLGLKVTGTTGSTGNAAKILQALQSGSMVIYNIGTYTYSGLGNTSGGHFGVIYGYDASTKEFLIHDPAKKSGASQRATYDKVNTYVRRATFVTTNIIDDQSNIPDE